MKQFELLDDCWTIVKEFAGIYNLTTKWSKLEKIGVEKVHDLFKTHAKRRLTNYKKDARQAKHILFKRLFTNFKSFELMNELKEMIDPPKIKIDIEAKFGDEVFKVGDEVLYCKDNTFWSKSKLGKIVKINKSSVSWVEYGILNSVSQNPSAYQQKTFETTKHYYDKSNLTTKPKAIKNFRVPEQDQFIYYTTTTDWGR
jgi:DNA-binding ferritin-like protein (Dps family)